MSLKMPRLKCFKAIRKMPIFNFQDAVVVPELAKYSMDPNAARKLFKIKPKVFDF